MSAYSQCLIFSNLCYHIGTLCEMGGGRLSVRGDGIAGYRS